MAKTKKTTKVSAKTQNSNKLIDLSLKYFTPIAVVLIFAISASWFLIFTQAAGYNKEAAAHQAKRIYQVRSAWGGVTPIKNINCLNRVADYWSYKMANGVGLAHNPGRWGNIKSFCGIPSDIKIHFTSENVGRGPDSSAIFNAFMASPSHKANIVDKDLNTGGRGGTGAYTDKYGRLWVTHVFVKCSGAGCYKGNWNDQSGY
jgi:uncharacterized protein YkwD